MSVELLILEGTYLEELGRNVLVDGVVLGEFKSDVEHVEAVECHPGRSISLSKLSTGRKRLRTVESTDVVQAEESTLEDVVSSRILSVYPLEARLLAPTHTSGAIVLTQVKFNNSFWKTRSRKSKSSLPVSFLSILKTRKVALKHGR